MADPLMSPRMALLDTVQQALLRIRREDGYIHSLEHGLATQKTAVANVQLDACPWVLVRLLDDTLTDKPISMQQLIEDTDVAIGALVKPDPNRWAETPVDRILEWLVWDIKRAMERHAGASQFGPYTSSSLSVIYGPMDSFGFATFVYTFGLRRTRGQ